MRIVVDAMGSDTHPQPDVAGAVAAALGEGVVFLTNVPGVLDDPARPDSLIPVLVRSDAAARIADGRIAGGMIPKVEAALAAVDLGAPFAVIADGRSAAAIRERGLGTRILPD